MSFCPSGFSSVNNDNPLTIHVHWLSFQPLEQMPKVIKFIKTKKCSFGSQFCRLWSMSSGPPCFGHVVRQLADDDRSQLNLTTREQQRKKKARVLLTSLQEQHPPGPTFPKFYCLSTPPSTLGTRFVDNVQTVSWIHAIQLNSLLRIHSVLLSMESSGKSHFPLWVWVFCLWHNSLVIPQIVSYFIQ